MREDIRIAYGYAIGRALEAARPSGRTLAAWPSVPKVRPSVVAVAVARARCDR